MKRNLMITMVLALFSVSAFAENAELKPDKEAVEAACAAEAKEANCGDAKVGTGLLKCIHGHKKEHKKEFKVSDSCKEAMRKLKSHRMEMKEKKHEAAKSEEKK